MRLQPRRQKVAEVVDVLDQADHMVLNVAEVRMHGLINQRHVEPHHAAAHLLQRLDRAPKQQQFVPDLVNPLDIRLVGGAGKDGGLQRIHLTFEFLQNREIVVDDEVHDGVEHEPGPVGQEMRHTLAARAHRRPRA